MKKTLILLLSVLLVVAICFPTVALAFTADVLENPTYQQNFNGFSYKEVSVSEDGSTRKIFYGEYNPTTNTQYEFVLHSIRSGTSTTRTTVLDIAKNYEETTGRKVVMATNGDYFDYNTGSNMESYVLDGVVVNKGVYAQKRCIGFDNNGKVAVGKLSDVETRLLVYDAEGNRNFFEIDKFNQQPQAGEIAIYDQAQTFIVENAGVMIVSSDSANLKNYPVYGKFKTFASLDVVPSKTFTLKSGQFAIVYDEQNQGFFNDLTLYGMEIDLVEIPAGDFAGCKWVVGGYDILVNNGVVGSNFHTDNSGNANRARTFIGFKADGTCFLCVVDETGGSTGITVTKEAELAAVLGAKYALELDGGGSSTMVIRVDDELTVRNKSIDGASMRKVSNAVLLVEKEQQQTTPSDPSDQPDDNPDNPIEIPQDKDKTLVVGDKSFTVTADKFLYNTEVTETTAPNYQMIVFDKNYKGTFATNGYGVALVFDGNQKLCKIYDGTTCNLYQKSSETAQLQNLDLVFAFANVQKTITEVTFDEKTFATVAFSKLNEGETLVILPFVADNPTGRAFGLSLRGENGGKSYLGESSALSYVFGTVNTDHSADQTKWETEYIVAIIVCVVIIISTVSVVLIKRKKS